MNVKLLIGDMKNKNILKLNKMLTFTTRYVAARKRSCHFYNTFNILFFCRHSIEMTRK